MPTLPDWIKPLLPRFRNNCRRPSTRFQRTHGMRCHPALSSSSMSEPQTMAVCRMTIPFGSGSILALHGMHISHSCTQTITRRHAEFGPIA